MTLSQIQRMKEAVNETLAARAKEASYLPQHQNATLIEFYDKHLLKLQLMLEEVHA